MIDGRAVAVADTVGVVGAISEFDSIAVFAVVGAIAVVDAVDAPGTDDAFGTDRERRPETPTGAAGHGAERRALSGAAWCAPLGAEARASPAGGRWSRRAAVGRVAAVRAGECGGPGVGRCFRAGGGRGPGWASRVAARSAHRPGPSRRRARCRARCRGRSAPPPAGQDRPPSRVGPSGSGWSGPSGRGRAGRPVVAAERFPRAAVGRGRPAGAGFRQSSPLPPHRWRPWTCVRFSRSAGGRGASSPPPGRGLGGEAGLCGVVCPLRAGCRRLLEAGSAGRGAGCLFSSTGRRTPSGVRGISLRSSHCSGASAPSAISLPGALRRC